MGYILGRLAFPLIASFLIVKFHVSKRYINKNQKLMPVSNTVIYTIIGAIIIFLISLLGSM